MSTLQQEFILYPILKIDEDAQIKSMEIQPLIFAGGGKFLPKILDCK